MSDEVRYGRRFVKESNGWTLVEVLVAVAILAVLGSMIFGPVVKAYWESETYNKLTGAKTTWWDALWVELRVQGEPNKEGNNGKSKPEK